MWGINVINIVKQSAIKSTDVVDLPVKLIRNITTWQELLEGSKVVGTVYYYYSNGVK